LCPAGSTGTYPNAGSDAPARELLTALGFPFAKK
jgi:hypothetical protein